MRQNNTKNINIEQIEIYFRNISSSIPTCPVTKEDMLRIYRQKAQVQSSVQKESFFTSFRFKLLVLPVTVCIVVIGLYSYVPGSKNLVQEEVVNQMMNEVFADLSSDTENSLAMLDQYGEGYSDSDILLDQTLSEIDLQLQYN